MAAEGMPGLTTYGPDVATSYPYPEGRKQYDYLLALGGWFMSHKARPPAIVVKCELDVQDQWILQLADPLRIMLLVSLHRNALA